MRDETSLIKAMRHSNVVINCIGQSHPAKLDYLMKETNVEGAENIARLSKILGIDRLIHVSLLKKTQNSSLQNSSNLSLFIDTKAAGEAIVLKERPDATIFRPASMWGSADHFLSYFASLARRVSLGSTAHIYLPDKGINTIQQPVYYGDVAEAISIAAVSPSTAGKIFEAVGPHRYRMDDLIKWIYFTMRYLPTEIKIVDNLLWKRLTELRILPQLLYQDSLTDQLTDNPTLEDIGVKLTKLEDRLHHILFWYRRYREYWDAVSEFPAPPSPPIQNQ
ncbi:unnamed protein product [Protopolystoma xenopodis]|uniref:NADH dehydrogenase [ubiquinone] 1 alpha subcomplex subunit 9, mitochondrial n=1 Tax=Protopolystoma xenopodis TaxID=117903 RepID=A0A448WQW3_9PLAT|nr:unnamed protein product [Protopolystoma xenopodis]